MAIGANAGFTFFVDGEIRRWEFQCTFALIFTGFLAMGFVFCHRIWACYFWVALPEIIIWNNGIDTFFEKIFHIVFAGITGIGR